MNGISLNIFEKGLIADNPHLYSIVLGKLIGKSTSTIDSYRKNLRSHERTKNIQLVKHNGVDVPYLFFDKSILMWKVRVRIDGALVHLASSNDKTKMFDVVDTYIYAINKGWITQ